MLDFLTNHAAQLANIMAILIPIVGFMTWSHRKLHKDIQELREDVKGAHSRIDLMGSRIDAMGARIDAMGARIDGLYQVMMEMLRKS